MKLIALLGTSLGLYKVDESGVQLLDTWASVDGSTFGGTESTWIAGNGADSFRFHVRAVLNSVYSHYIGEVSNNSIVSVTKWAEAGVDFVERIESAAATPDEKRLLTGHAAAADQATHNLFLWDITGATPTLLDSTVVGGTVSGGHEVKQAFSIGENRFVVGTNIGSWRIVDTSGDLISLKSSLALDAAQPAGDDLVFGVPDSAGSRATVYSTETDTFVLAAEDSQGLYLSRTTDEFFGGHGVGAAVLSDELPLTVAHYNGDTVTRISNDINLGIATLGASCAKGDWIVLTPSNSAVGSVVKVNPVAKTVELITQFTFPAVLTGVGLSDPTPVGKWQWGVKTQGTTGLTGAYAERQTTITDPGVAFGLAPNTLSTVAPSLGTPVLTQSVFALAAAALVTSAPVFSAPDVSQNHQLGAVGVDAQAPTIEVSSLGQNHSLASPALDTGSAEVGVASINQQHTLDGVTVEFGIPEVGSSGIAQIHVLATPELTTTPVFTKPSIVVVGSDSLLVDNFTAGPFEVPAVGLGQHHLLPTADSTDSQPVVFDTPLMVGVVHFDAVGLVSGVVELTAPSLQQVHGLGAAGISTGFEIEQASVGQAQILASGNITAGPYEVGVSDLGQVHAVAAVSLDTQVPDLGVPITELITNAATEGLETPPVDFTAAELVSIAPPDSLVSQDNDLYIRNDSPSSSEIRSVFEGASFTERFVKESVTGLDLDYLVVDPEGSSYGYAQFGTNWRVVKTDFRGQYIWKSTDLFKGASNRFGYRAAFNPVNNTLAVADDVKSVRLLDAETGETIWTKSLLFDITAPELSDLSFHRGQLYVSQEANDIFRLDVATGDVAETITIPGPSVRRALVVDDQIYVVTDGTGNTTRVAGYDLDSLAENFSLDGRSGVSAVAPRYNGGLVFSEFVDDGAGGTQTNASQVTPGGLVWRSTGLYAGLLVWDLVATPDNTIFAVSENGQFFSHIDPSDGAHTFIEPSWLPGSVTRARIGATPGVYTSPIIADQLTAGNLATAAPDVSTVTLGLVGFDFVTAATLTGSAPVVDAASIGQAHALTAPELTTTPVLDAPSLAQNQVVTADGTAAGVPEIEVASLAQNQVLNITALEAGTPVIGAADVGQAHVMFGVLTEAQAPVFTQPTLTELAALQPLFVIGNPVLSEPALAQHHALINTTITSGAVVLGQPALFESSFALDATDLLSAPYEVAAPTVTESSFALMAQGATGSAATLGTPSITQAHVLAAVGFATPASEVEVTSLNNDDLGFAVVTQCVTIEREILSIEVLQEPTPRIEVAAAKTPSIAILEKTNRIVVELDCSDN